MMLRRMAPAPPRHHDPHEYALPTIPPDPAAVMATGAEHVLLILGLATRLRRLGCLA